MNTTVRSRHAALLRRLTLTVTPERVEAFDDATPAELVDTVLSTPPTPHDPPDLTNGSDHWSASEWWLERMGDPSAGFDERLVWFWHGHLTSGLDKANAAAMLDQLELLRRHARGGFRELLREISTDPAMLMWLDGAGSSADAPNENYARELMELFALGRDSSAYDEADVRAGARALAGYRIGDGDDRPVEFDPDAALRGSVGFLGTRVSDLDDVIDAVCDRPECVRFLTTALHEHFIGGPPDSVLHDRMVEAAGGDALDVDAALRVLLFDRSFLDGPAQRPRSALEWYLALQQLILERIDFWPLEQMGQTPLNPPDVAGWRGSHRWVSAGLALTKGQIALDNSWDTDTLDRDDPVADVLRRAVLYDVSPTTRSTLEELADSASDRRQQASLLHAAVAMCPEFSRS